MKHILYGFISLIVLSLMIITLTNYHNAYADSGLISWWTGDTDASDSQDVNNGELVEGATAWNPSPHNGAFTFDGIGSYVSVSHSSSLDLLNGHTIDLWVKVDTTPSNSEIGAILINKWSSGLEDKLLFVDPSGHVGYYFYPNFENILTSNFVLVPGEWAHVVATYDGTAAKICINGVEDISRQTTGDISNEYGVLYFGNNPDREFDEPTLWEPFNGEIDEIKWYDRGLTNEESQIICSQISSDNVPPEVYNQFDPITKNVLVYGTDDVDGNLGSIVPTTITKVKWNTKYDDEGGYAYDNDESDEHDGVNDQRHGHHSSKTNAELRTYEVTDHAGNSIKLTEVVKQKGNSIKVKVTSIQYGDSPAIIPNKATKNFEWSTNKDGTIKELEQKMTVGKDKTKQKIVAKYESKKNETTIKSEESKTKWTIAGLVLLKMNTDNGNLVISHESN